METLWSSVDGRARIDGGVSFECYARGEGGNARRAIGYYYLVLLRYMYSVSDYGSMMADDSRMKAYSEALRRVVNSESIVIDIGAGTGIFALLACRFGARRVYAIE